MVHQRIVLEVPPDIFEAYMAKRGNRTHAKALMDGMGIPYETPIQGRPRRSVDDIADSLNAKAHARADAEGKSLWKAAFDESKAVTAAQDAKDAAKRRMGT